MIATIQVLASWLEPLMLVAMVMVFALTAISLYWPGRRNKVERPGLIPFEED